MTSEHEAMIQAGEEGDFEAWLDSIGANYPVVRDWDYDLA
jgi:hypothetical protein